MKLKLQRKAADGAAPAKPRRRKPVKRIIAAVLAAAVVCGGVFFFRGRTAASAATGTTAYTTAQVTYRDITSTITGSGTLEAANSYSVSTLAEGTILTADFEEGDQVTKGDILYTIDSSDASNNLEKAQLSLSQSQRSYASRLDTLDDLTVTAPVAGRVISLDVEVGDEVQAGQTVATVRNSDVMSLTVPFPETDAAGISAGMAATITLDSTFETLSGAVREVSAVTSVLSGGRIVREVTIDVTNPGGLTAGEAASAAVGDALSAAGGTLAYKDEAAVTAKTAGTVAFIAAPEGTYVAKHAAVLTLTSDTLENEVQAAADSLRSAELSLESQEKQLEDYTITSPISGTVIDKNYNAGETSEANKVLCTIYDLTYLTMTLSVDELDVGSIEVGQIVAITADAAEGRTYEGVVTKVSVAGSTSSGVTTYPVTIRIDETEGLLPGMNVDAVITLASADHVLAIPVAALQRGNLVLVTADSPSAANAVRNDAGNENETDGKADRSSGDYVSVSVTTGVTGDDYVEITSGLAEGDTVAYIPVSSSSGDMMMAMGGMPGGGMPGGGGGGMPGGGPGGF